MFKKNRQSPAVYRLQCDAIMAKWKAELIQVIVRSGFGIWQESIEICSGIIEALGQISVKLTHYGPVTPYGTIKLVHYWFRPWLTAWRQQAINWTDNDLLLILWKNIQWNFNQNAPVSKMHLKILSAKHRPFCLEASELVPLDIRVTSVFWALTLKTVFFPNTENHGSKENLDWLYVRKWHKMQCPTKSDTFVKPAYNQHVSCSWSNRP